MKPLLQQVIEEQIRRAERELMILDGTLPKVEVPNELAESEYLERSPVNSGSEFLEVRASLWENTLKTGESTPVKSLEHARVLAKKRGYEGITITW